jgi:hypothetical protein
MEVASSSSNKFSTSKYRKFSRRQRQLSRSAVSCAVITNYFELENKSAEDETSVLQDEIKSLKKVVMALKENKAKTVDSNLEKVFSANPLLKVFSDSGERNGQCAKTRRRYEQKCKDVAKILFLFGGNSCYQFLHSNMPSVLPSPSLLLRDLHSATPPKEGDIRCKELRNFIEKNGYEPYVFISEDATRIVGKLEFDTMTNSLSGSAKALLENGLSEHPVRLETASDICRSAALPVAHNAYVTVAKIPGGKSFVLSLHATDNRFTGPQISSRWRTMNELLGKEGML